MKLRARVSTALLPALAVLAAAAQEPPSSAAAGRPAFRIYCSPCHGIQGRGGRAPDLTRSAFQAGATDDDLFRAVSQGVPGTNMTGLSGELEPGAIRQLVAYVRSLARSAGSEKSGDPAAGQTLFWGKGGCARCHRAGPGGRSIGPDLTRIGRQLSPAFLLESIVAPDADISPGYATIRVVARNGGKFEGVERNFDNFSAQFVDLDGNYYSFERQDVTSMERLKWSAMPGFGMLFNTAELNDLVAYLMTLRGAR